MSASSAPAPLLLADEESEHITKGRGETQKATSVEALVEVSPTWQKKVDAKEDAKQVSSDLSSLQSKVLWSHELFGPLVAPFLDVREILQLGLTCRSGRDMVFSPTDDLTYGRMRVGSSMVLRVSQIYPPGYMYPHEEELPPELLLGKDLLCFSFRRVRL